MHPSYFKLTNKDMSQLTCRPSYISTVFPSNYSRSSHSTQFDTFGLFGGVTTCHGGHTYNPLTPKLGNIYVCNLPLLEHKSGPYYDSYSFNINTVRHNKKNTQIKI